MVYTLYSLKFMLNTSKLHYCVKKRSFEFILTAIAYHAKPAQNQEFKITHSNKVMQRLKKMENKS